MSDILASVSVVLGAEISAFRAAMAQANKDLKGLRQAGEAMKDVGTSLSTYVSLPLAALGTAAVVASAKMESLKKGVEAITAADLGKQGITGLAGLQLAAQQAGDRLKVLEVIAKAPGIGFEQAVAGDIRLRAVGISAQQSAKSLKEFANAIATTGGGASEFDRVTTQLAQLSAKGKVLSQDLRPIIEAAPAVSQALLKLYGTIDSESISASLTKQGKSSQDFIAILTDELAKLPRVTGGLANSLENLQQTAVQAAAKLGDGISKALDLPNVTEGLANGIERLGNAFANLNPSTQKLIVGLGLAAAATGPVLVAVGTLGAALPALTAGFATLGITSAAALGPVGIAAAAVAVAAALIIDNWSDLTAYFSSSGEGGRVFSDLATSVTNSVSQITDAFSALNGGGNFGDLVSATGIFKAIFRDITVGITAVSNVFGGSIGAIVKLLSGDLAGAAAQGERALAGLLQPLANVLGFQLRLSEATQGVTEKFDALAVVTPGLAAVLNNLSTTTPFPPANLGGITRTLGLLEELKARLKEVQEQRDKETTVGAIKVDNTEIISLQKRIAELEGTTKKGTDAVAKLRLELSRLTTLDNLLGDAPSQLEVLERRSDTLLKGLKTLVDAGVSPNSRAFRSFALEAANLGQQIDQLKAIGGTLDLKPVAVKSLIPQTIGDTLPQDVARLLGDYAKQTKPFELPIAVKLNMQGIAEAMQPVQLLSKQMEGLNDIKIQPKFDGFVPKTLKAELLSLGAGFQQIKANSVLFGSSFDEAGAKAQVLGQTIQNLIASGMSPYSQALQELAQQQRAYSVESEVARLNNETLQAGFEALGTSVGEAIGNMAFNGASAGDALKGVFASLIDVLAQYAAKRGKIMIADGLVDLLIPGQQALGALKIAAGTGLLIASGIASAGAGSLRSSAAGGGGRPSSAPSSSVPSSPRSFTPSTAPGAAAQPSATYTHKVEIVASGPNLAGVLTLSTDRLGRVIGRR
ncbi:tape measure protein [Hymenobacter sp. BT559]|uniref:tape measure protein n=1 Tax=Hymenobacter sp. BT559 TaxID=2795729 RepID=UPI0018ED6B92|nr:tape measure protein [Hymenobacter sp. BT559]MBJ6145743.1 tape measure protein [Hymenobacter sp. BT559]